MPLPNDADEKWRLKEHTEVKHDILQKYLVPWVRVLSSGNARVHFFDGFAGRGTYEDGEPGSPLLAMDVADRNSELFEEFLCTFVELNDNNYEDLERAVETKKEECTDKIEINKRNDSFELVINELIENIGHGSIIPSFFFIDPFGYNSMPFETVSNIFNLRETGVEVFLTFMVRDIRRFLDNEGHEDSITRILGTDDWKEIEGENKEKKILQIYEEKLKNEAGVNYVWPFEMKMPERSETVYYLIHATNHFKGFKIMKDVMFSAGAEDQFAYLGPDHYGYDDEQKTLFESSDTDDERIEDLADVLFSRLEDERLTFWEVMERTYTETDLIEKHYRDAIYLLEERHKATIHNNPDQSNGTIEGLDDDDEVEFVKKYGSIQDW
jgi:three-Cys-motif partner protein